MEIKIFYSWQSRTDRRKNKNYIYNCILKAIKQAEKKITNVSYIVEDGAGDKSGSPDIASTIRNEMTANCDIFIADLSIINSNTKKNSFISKLFHLDYTPFMNENVLIEYGIAYGNKSEDSLISIMNIEYGDPRNDSSIMPFDISTLRFPIFYKYKENQEDFIKQLSNAIVKCTKTALYKKKNEYKPFDSWAMQSLKKSINTKFYTNKYIDKLCANIKNSTSDIRLLGLSGTGKTRIVYESFRPINDTDISEYYYCDSDYTNDAEICNSINKLFENQNFTGVIVVDNCSKQLLRKIVSLKNDTDTKSKIITINNETEEDFEIPNINYITISITELKSIVDQILDNVKDIIDEYNLQLIKDFSSGLPFMAVLLLESFKVSNLVGPLQNKHILEKLLSANNEEKEILKSCSLFNEIGYENSKKSQIQFILTNKNITPGINGSDSYILALFFKLFTRYKKREIFESYGDLFTIRPKPISINLAYDWLEECDSSRFEGTIKDLQDYNDKYLIESLCKQFDYLSSNPKASEMVEKLLKGPFDNAKVLLSDVGSRLFRSLINVNPIAAIQNIERNLSSLSQKDIKLIDGISRRNIIWSLEKGCFYQPTFFIASKLMLKFALSENENYGNNATNQFLHLFRIHLPGTEANLRERYQLIEYCLSEPDLRDFGFKAINSALKIDSFFIGGAEKQGLKKLEHYSPKKEEIIEYWTNIIKIIEKEIYEKGSNSSFCYSILAHSFREFYRFNYEDNTLPLIQKIIDEGKNDWDEMYDTLCLIRDYDLEIFQRHKDVILSLIKKLEKTDFISRFIAVSDYKHNKNLLAIKPEESLQYFRKQYGELAQEFVETKQPLSQLTKIYETKYINPIGFGEKLAILLKDDDKKIKEIIDITIDYITKHDQYPQILIDFSKGITIEQFSYLSDKLSANEKLAQYLFPIMGCRRFSLKDIDLLFYISKKYPKLAFCFKDYWHNLPYDNWDHDENASIHFKELSEFGIPGINAILYIIFAFNNETKSKYPNTLRVISEIFSEIDLFNNEIDKNFLIHALKYLLSNNNPKLAKHINLKFMDYIYEHKQNPFSIDVAYYKELYEILIKQYFDAIWDDLLIGLTSVDDKFIIFYKLKDLLGGHNSYGDKYDNNENNGIFFNSISCLQIKKDLDKSEVLQSRIMGISPTFNPDSEKTSFSESSIFLLENYTSNKKILEEFISNMHTFSCFGSMAPYFQKCKFCMDAIINNTINTRLKDWAKEQSSHLDEIIKNENKRDEEAKLLYE